MLIGRDNEIFCVLSIMFIRQWIQMPMEERSDVIRRLDNLGYGDRAKLKPRYSSRYSVPSKEQELCI